jgi:hypothetical protein
MQTVKVEPLDVSLAPADSDIEALSRNGKRRRILEVVVPTLAQAMQEKGSFVPPPALDVDLHIVSC